MSLTNSPKFRRLLIKERRADKLYVRGFCSKTKGIKCPVCGKPGVLFVGDGVVKHKQKYVETTYCHINPKAA